MWLNRRQVRWLVVLLALLPLLPAIVAMRFAFDNARRERDEAVAEETRIYRDQLIHLVTRISLNAPGNAGGGDLSRQLKRIFGEGVSLSVRGPGSAALWSEGTAPSPDAIKVVIQEGRFADWTVILDHVVDLPDHLDEQMREAWWRAGGWALAVALVAAVVWFAVHRGLRVEDLRSDLLTTVSHEMKTPLAAMRVLLETLADGVGDADEGPVAAETRRREYLELALVENRRLTRVAEDFLTFARLERGDFSLRNELCDLDTLIEDILAELGPPLESAGAWVEHEGSGLRVWGDGDALAAIVRNLVENALKYGIGADGAAEIRLSSERTESPRRLRLIVADRGPGIAPALRRSIFRRFFREDDRLAGASSGVGLGLAICRQFARRMKGRIAWEPNPGGGSRFVVTLPAAPSAAGEAARSPRLDRAVAPPEKSPT